MKKFVVILLVTSIMLTLATKVTLDVSSPNIIQVYAGADQSLCNNQDLIMTNLQATITGDVHDGDWITFGDGRFQPGNLLTVRYSVAQQNGVKYVPGTNDKALGFFRLMVISDAPVGGTPQQKVNDEVITSFQSPPPLFCSNNINISLNESCSQKVDATMLQPNPVQPYSNYIITLYDPKGNVIPDNVLTKDHVDKEITFKLGHLCTSNTCWGKFKVEDYFAPVFVCKNDTIFCNRSFSPDSLGFPIPVGAFIDTIIQQKYIVKNWDACSDVTLEYTDVTVKGECTDYADKVITRKWKASDAKGNISYCNEKIVIKRIGLSQVVFPRNFDGHDLPAFECGASYPTLSNGYPSTDTTGMPNLGACGNLQYSVNDVPFALCGNSYKIVRSWFVIEWCSAQSITKNQIIHIKDSVGPIFECVDSLRLQANGYECATSKTKLPAIINVDDCSIFTASYILKDQSGLDVGQFITVENNEAFVVGLPVGSYTLSYVLTDACGNATTCKTYLQVVDLAPPYPSCESQTKVSLDNNGKARLFATSLDDGSIDNCGVAGFKVRKMSDACSYGLQSGDYVDFCCAELGKKIMVALEVTDIHGNTNTCMVEVTVDDKLKPTITCPPNITLSCTDNYDLAHLDIFGKVVTDLNTVKNIVIQNHYHNGIVGKDGLAKDNCTVTVTEKYTTNIHCHTGQIFRTFIATDGQGLKDSCTQTITILNPDPFAENNITWPTHYYGNGCRSDQSDPSVTGKPTFSNTSCGNIAATYEDTPFYIADGACVKIIRLWTVVDWCQFDGVNTKGKWGPYTQIIKLHNTDKPVILSSCSDTTFCSYDNDCKKSIVTLTAIAEDSCTSTEDLVWNYSIDQDRNGTIDQSGSNSIVTIELPIGQHSITWLVSDQCGNTATCTRKFEIKDCKKPTPYCYSSLTLPLDQVDGSAVLWAKDINKGSYDNCNDTTQLIYTFGGDLPVSSMKNKQHYFKDKALSNIDAFLQGDAQLWLPDKNSSALHFDCSDIADGKVDTITLEMTVTDAIGNQDKCSVEVILQDNAKFCPDLIQSVSVGGHIATTYQKIPEDITVSITSPEVIGQVLVNTADGKYSMVDLPNHFEYTIKPSLNSDPTEGVTTLDLVYIQRHILNLEPITDPYKLIAADANASKSVSASDLVEIRKLIIGKSTQFPKGLPSWVFIPKNGGIPNPAAPHDYKTEIKTGILNQDTSQLDFVAVKIGDVNDSAIPFQNSDWSSRTVQKQKFALYYSLENDEDGSYLVFRSKLEGNIEGFQVFIDTYDEDFEIEDLQFEASMEYDYNIMDNKLSLLAYASPVVTIAKDEILFKVKISGNDQLSGVRLSQIKRSEGYFNDKILPITISLKNELLSGFDFKLATNPVTENLYIVLNTTLEEAQLNYQITNISGISVATGSIEHYYQEEILLPLDHQLLPGVYYLTLRNNGIQKTTKFIKIK